jgi:hypothetical protein
MEKTSNCNDKNDSLLIEKTDHTLIKISERVSKVDLFWCIMTRIMFLTQSGYVIYNLIMLKNNFWFSILFVGMLAIFLDGAYIIRKRKGKEHLWFEIS